MADGFVHIKDAAAPILNKIFENHMEGKNVTGRKPTPAEIARRTPLGASAAVAHSDSVTGVKNRNGSSNEEYRARYMRDLSGGANPGRKVKFTKDGEFVTTDDGLPLPKSATYRFLGDETEISWIKFDGPGVPPERHGGLLYSDYRLPDRGGLGDDDESQWETGLGGKPQDPWQHQISLSFQSCASGEMFVFVTGSKTGHKACGRLLSTYDRMRASGDVPLVQLVATTAACERIRSSCRRAPFRALRRCRRVPSCSPSIKLKRLSIGVFISRNCFACKGSWSSCKTGSSTKS